VLKPKSKRGARVAKEAKDVARNGRAAAIRKAVFARANGLCEFCKEDPPAEWHHIFSGGLRKTREAENTTAATCEDCHDKYHDSDLLTLRRAQAWALELHFVEAQSEIGRRIDGVYEVRRSTPSLARPSPETTT
jgi:hypothetical protein